MKSLFLIFGLIASVLSDHAAYDGHHVVHGAPSHHGAGHDAVYGGHKAVHGAPAHHGAVHGAMTHHGSDYGSHAAPSAKHAAHKSVDKSHETDGKKSGYSAVHDYVISNDRQSKAAKAASKVSVSGSKMYKHLLKPATKVEPSKTKTVDKKAPKSHEHKFHSKHRDETKLDHLYGSPDLYKPFAPPAWYDTPHRQPHQQKYFPKPQMKYEPHEYDFTKHQFGFDLEEPKYKPQPQHRKDYGFPIAYLPKHHGSKHHPHRPQMKQRPDNFYQPKLEFSHYADFIESKSKYDHYQPEPARLHHGHHHLKPHHHSRHHHGGQHRRVHFSDKHYF